MASSGSFLTKGWYSESKGDYVYLEFAWSVQSTSIANNSTTIYWELRGKRAKSGYVNAGGFKVVIDGSTVYEKSTDYRIELRNGTVVANGTYTLVHGDTGNRSFSASAQGGIYYYAVNSTGSGHWDLPSLPRQAIFGIVSSFTDEGNPAFTYSNPANSLVERIDACISLDGSKDDIPYRTIPLRGSSYTFELTDAERELLRKATTNTKSRTVYYYLRSLIGGKHYYTSIGKTLTIVNAEPTFTVDNVHYGDSNGAIVAITGNPQSIVQGFSSLTAHITSATAKKGATIKRYTIELNGATKTVANAGLVEFGAINSTQDVTMTVTVEDSRGYTTKVEKVVTMFAWSAPTFTATVERINNYETDTVIKPNVRYSSVDGKNVLTVTYRSKKVGGEYGNAVEITKNQENIASLDNNYDYWVLVSIADSFGGTASSEYYVPKGKFPFFIDTEKEAVGINEFPSEGEALRVAGGVACFEDGNHEMQFNEARLTAGIGATEEEWERFFEQCLELIRKFK